MQDNIMAKLLWIAVALTGLVSVLPARAAELAPAPLVVVELFTSQGCSSCPPADAYLGKLSRQPGVLALGFHVDYWNYIGWTDPYSLPLAAARQRAYGRRLGLHYVYTPQMIVDGGGEGVGSQPDKIVPLLHAARQRPQFGPTVSLEKRDTGFHIHVGAGKAPSDATVWLVGIDRIHETKVLRGENEGTTAQDYQIVRSFKSVGSWRGQALDLDLPSGAATGDQIAVLVQLDGTGPILTAATLPGPSS
jgi:hypothetical protein